MNPGIWAIVTGVGITLPALYFQPFSGVKPFKIARVPGLDIIAKIPYYLCPAMDQDDNIT